MEIGDLSSSSFLSPSAFPMDAQAPPQVSPGITKNRVPFPPPFSVFAGETTCAISALLLLCFLLFFSVPQPFLIDRPVASAGACDYTRGRWVWDESIPQRTYSEECPFLDPGFRCHRNGRKDGDYVKWRWQPHGCHLPRVNASDMLESSRNSRIVFAGDSIGRNHWESLVCLLASAVRNQSSIYESNGNPITKHKGYLSIRFHDHNLTVEYYRTPFLVLVDRPPADSPPQVKRVVRLDKLHWRSEQWVGADILVFNAGHWWNQDKTSKMGCYFQEGDHINTTMDVREAFRRSLQTWKQWVLQNLHPQKSYVFFRSYSPVHFGYGVAPLIPNTSGKWFDCHPHSSIAFYYSHCVQFLTTHHLPCISSDAGGAITLLVDGMRVVFGINEKDIKGGTWDQGGRCDLNTAPETNFVEIEDEPWSNMDVSETIEQMRGENKNVQFLNITYLTKFRRDAHPSIHREPGTPVPFAQDCSHWCLPGVPDTWNQLLYAYMVLMGKRTAT